VHVVQAEELATVDRAALYAKTATRQPLRAHDLRATFITVRLANGQSEAWVADRTGHKTSAMINRYRRAARSLAELQLGDLTPLNEAIPEFAVPFETALKRLSGDPEKSGSKGSVTIPHKNNGSRGRTRTDTSKGYRILNPARLPIPPLGRGGRSYSSLAQTRIP